MWYYATAREQASHADKQLHVDGVTRGAPWHAAPPQRPPAWRARACARAGAAPARARRAASAPRRAPAAGAPRAARPPGLRRRLRASAPVRAGPRPGRGRPAGAAPAAASTDARLASPSFLTPRAARRACRRSSLVLWARTSADHGIARLRLTTPAFGAPATVATHVAPGQCYTSRHPNLREQKRPAQTKFVCAAAPRMLPSASIAQLSRAVHQRARM